MSALPKQKPSTRRQGKRRAVIKLKLPTLVECRHCGSKKKPHIACPECGKYKKTDF